MTLLPRVVGGWQCLLADPPWHFKSFDGQSAVPTQASDPYETMTLDDLMGMNVRGIAAKNSLLAMWTIGTHLEMALRLGRVWGFSYVTDLFIWDKGGEDGDRIGMGYHTRKQAEICLLFKRGNGLPVKNHAVRQIIREPKRQHSRKPDKQYDRLDALYGTHLRRLELFARQERPGWTGWGLEKDKFSVEADRSHPVRDRAQFLSSGIPLQVVTPPTDQSDVIDGVAPLGTEAVDAG